MQHAATLHSSTSWTILSNPSTPSPCGDSVVRLSAAFKNALTERRMAVRIAVQVHAQELEEGRVEQANLADGYKTRVETLG